MAGSSLLIDASDLLDHEQLLLPGDFGIDQVLLRDLPLCDLLLDLARVTFTLEPDLPLRLRLAYLPLELLRDFERLLDFLLDLDRRERDLDLLEPDLDFDLPLRFLERDLLLLLLLLLLQEPDLVLDLDLLMDLLRLRDLELLS